MPVMLGSSDSVVPTFERQIAEGGPLTVTHPDVMRFFMTIPEAAGLVLQSCALGKGGEIFVLDMGKPVKIAELARQMIKLSGLEPDRDIEIKFTGLRPGEKLYEELRHLRSGCTDTSHPRIKRLVSEPVSLEKITAQLSRLRQELHTSTTDDLKLMLKEILPEYTPHFSSGKNVSPDPNAKTKCYENTEHCPLVSDRTGDAKPNQYCHICSSFRLCVWQQGWNMWSDPAVAEAGASEGGTTVGLSVGNAVRE